MTRQLKKANVQEALEIALAEHDLTTDRLASVVDEAMSATKVLISSEGEVVDGLPDHSIRLKAAGMAANWMGVGKQEGGIGNTFNFNFNKDTDKPQKKYIDA